MSHPIVLLLDCYEANASAVREVLTHLEAQRIISVQYHKRNALSFAADVSPEPSALLMYLDRSELVSVMFTENAYLLKLFAAGFWSLGRSFRSSNVTPVGQNEALDLIGFLAEVLNTSKYNLCVDN